MHLAVTAVSFHTQSAIALTSELPVANKWWTGLMSHTLFSLEVKKKKHHEQSAESKGGQVLYRLMSACTADLLNSVTTCYYCSIHENYNQINSCGKHVVVLTQHQSEVSWGSVPVPDSAWTPLNWNEKKNMNIYNSALSSVQTKDLDIICSVLKYEWG